MVVAEPRRLERLDEIDVEVPLGLSRRPIVGRAEEEITVALDAPVLPLDLILPDLVAGDVGGLVGALHQLADGAVVGAIERIIGQGFSALLDLGVVIDVLLQIEIVLLGVRRLGDELAVDGLQRLPQDGLHERQQIGCRLAAHVFDAGLEQAQRVAEFLGGRADGNVDVTARRQAMDRKTVDDPQAPSACRPDA